MKENKDAVKMKKTAPAQQRAGVWIGGAMAVAYKRLGDLLVSIGLISEDDLNRALSLQKQTNKRLGKVLTEYNIISEQQLIEALELQLGVEFIDLSKTPIAPEMARVVPKNIAKKHGVVPVRVVKDDVFLASTTWCPCALRPTRCAWP